MTIIHPSAFYLWTRKPMIHEWLLFKILITIAYCICISKINCMYLTRYIKKCCCYFYVLVLLLSWYDGGWTQYLAHVPWWEVLELILSLSSFLVVVNIDTILLLLLNNIESTQRLLKLVYVQLHSPYSCPSKNFGFWR